VYEVEVVAEMGRWKRDYHHVLPFVVINPKIDYRIGDRYYLGKEQEKKEGQPLLDLTLETKDGTEELPKFIILLTGFIFGLCHLTPSLLIQSKIY
jgi:hypothetical protein